jgi:hypothetical protein
MPRHKPLPAFVIGPPLVTEATLAVAAPAGDADIAAPASSRVVAMLSDSNALVR